MNVEEIKKEIIRAEKSLNSAKILVKNNYFQDAISRCYYGILHAAKAALLVENINVSSHKAVRRLFGQQIIKTGKLDSKYAKILASIQDDRVRADYDVIYLAEEEDVKESLKIAEDFLNAIKEYLNTRIELHNTNC
jgi:uncharacterized protein (UPF0332 family)